VSFIFNKIFLKFIIMVSLERDFKAKSAYGNVDLALAD
jgi:hypothetical protein